ncbi:MAG: S4 domain-containing protein [Bacteroidetes bacterium]|nr:S4 domain-containing protein [Bacteroidota bacterium]
MEEGTRIDKWLWAVRIFKTRSQATIACRNGKIRVRELIVKPSHEVKSGEIIEVNIPPFKKMIKVLGMIENRVSAQLAVNFVEDLTPPEEYQKIKRMREMNFEYRERGLGRPTKKERRNIDGLKGYQAK